MSIGFERIEQVTKEIEERNARRSAQWKQQSSPAPAKPKYEYSTDNLSMLDLAGGAMTGVVSADVSENVVSAVAPFTGAVSTIVETASDTAAYLKGSNAYRKYLATDEEKKREAQAISIETGIPVNALLYSDENMAKGRSVQEYTKKRMALAPEGIKDWDDMDAVYAKFPGLKEIVENPNMSDTDVAIAMHNIEDLTRAKDEVEAFSLGLAADKANYRIGELGMIGFAGGEMTPEMKKEIASIKKSIPEQKSTPNLLDDPSVAIAGGVGANIYHMRAGIGKGLKYAAAPIGAAIASTLTGVGAVTAPVALSAAGIGFRVGMAEDMFMNSAGRHYVEYSEMKSKDGEALLTQNEARAFAAIAAGMETGVEFWNYGQIMNLLGANYKRDIMEIVAKASGNQAMLKAGMSQFIRERVLQAAKAGATEAAEEAVQDASDKAVHNAIVTYAPQAAYRKYTGTEFAKGALEASAEALPGIIGLGVIGGTVSNFKSVSDFARLQKEQNDIFFAEMKRANGLAMIKNLQANMAESKLFKKNPEIYQAAVKGAVENTEFKEVRVDTELALQDEEGAVVFNQLVEEMGLEQEEVNAIIENKADLIVPTEIYAQTVMNNDKFDQYISFDEKGHSAARKKYYMAVAEEMAKSISIEQEEKQAELIDGIITANFPEAGIEQDMGAAIILSNPSNPMQAWKQMKHDTETAINARLGNIVKKLEEGMSRGVHMYYSDEIGHPAKRMSDNDEWYSDFYKKHKRKPNKAELWEMAREIYKGGGERYQMPEYTFEVTDEMQEDFDALDQDFANLDILNNIKGKVENLTASEMAVVRGLTPSGYKVYQAARKQFERGNADVQKAGRMNAILFARYADRMADNISKITGREYTAEDYMRERTSIVADATEVDESGYNHPITNLDLNLDKEVDVLDLDEMSNALKGKGYKDVIAYIKENSDNARVPSADFKVMLGLPNYTDTYGQRHIVFNNSSKIRRNVTARDKTLSNLFDVVFASRVVEVSPNKKIKEGNLTDAQKRKNEVERFYRLFVPVKMKNSLYTLIITAEDFNKNVEIDAQEISLYQISTQKIEGNRLSGSLETDDSSSAGTLPSKISIRDMLRGVKDVDGNPYINPDGSGKFAIVHNQTAYHGTPHTFDTFDLGAIGTGEGRQAHGWGLYFAQDKRVSEGYQSRLIKKDNVVVQYDGKENIEIAQALKHFASGSVYSALVRGTRDNAKIAEEIAKIVTTLRAGYRSDVSFIEFLSKHIGRIEENPKLSIAKFLKEASKEDADRLKGIVDSAKYVAKMDGRRANIHDVLDRLEVTLRPFADKREWEIRNADILESIDLNKLEIVGATGSLFEVDVPDNDVLLNEDKPLTEQPLKVRQAIAEYCRQRPDDYIAPKDENDLSTMNGKQFYKDVVFQMRMDGETNPERAASETLNALGIKGITYEGGRDGRCFVVFDDKAISVIERYNQSVRGQMRISGMERVVSLFESADKSTFVHELGHVALADLKMLAEMEGAPAQLVRDWQTVKEWLGYKDSQGFTREQHEKFARGFEAYLRSGEAPVRGLKSVFRMFKKWLCDIYADFVQLGGKPSAEVRAVMARMLASEQEIEAEAKVQGIESITKKKGMQILDDTTQAMYERWVREAKEEAKEKVLKIAMQDVSDDYAKQREEVIASIRQGIEDSLKEQDIFRAEECVRLSGSMDILPTLGYTEESYKAELAMYGGSLEAAVKTELDKAVADLDTEKVSEERIKAEAEKALSSSEYKAMILTLEIEALERKEAEESRFGNSVNKALDEIEKDLRGEEEHPKDENKAVKSLKQKIADLKYTYRWREAERKIIDRLQKAEAKEEKEKAIKDLKEAIKKSRNGIRLSRGTVIGRMTLYRQAASNSLAKMPIRQATATYSWRHKERMKGAEVAKLMAKGKWQEAKQAKLEQVMFSYFADESAKLKADVDKKVNKLKKRSNSIAKGNVKLAADERYFYNHLLYVFGVNRRDAIMPQEWQGSKSVDAMFKRYAEGYEAHFLDEDGEVDIPQFIKDAAGGNDVYKTQVNIKGRKNPVKALGYGALTKDEFDGLFDILTSVYTIGQNANRLFTVIDENGKAVSFDEAVQRITDGIRKNVKIKENDDPTGMTKKERYEKILAGGKKLFHDLVKPETFFRRNDGNKEGASMMCLYDPLKHASDKELKMRAEAAKELKRLFDEHGREDWNKKQYKLGTSILTKEQVIVLALNWGTEINRKRVLDGHKKRSEENEKDLVNLTAEDVEEVLGNLTAEDWRFVTGLWNLVGSYWEETVAVEERMTGVGLKKQEAVPFDIVGQDGTVYHLAGGYYPIMYDPEKSIQAANQKQDDAAKQQMSGNAVLGTRRGHTKSRVEGTVERPIHTTLDPLSRHIGDVIHNICYREAVRDVNKLINDQEVQAAFVDAYGRSVYISLTQWVKDCWAMDEKSDNFSQLTAMLRRNTTVAVLSYRTMTALLNVANFFPMVEYIGAGRALKAVLEMRKNPFAVARFVCQKSSFVANRVETMDRDVRERLARESSSKIGKVKDAFDARAFYMLALTDQMLAVPLWMSEYNRVYSEGVEKNLDPGVIEQQAVDAGDAAVRRVFGSGEVKDLAPVQRGSEVAKLFTMYYSYMNTVFNAIEYRRGRLIDAKERIKFLNCLNLWMLMPAITTALLRTMISDDDEDFFDEWYERSIKEIFGQAVGVFPLARDLFSAVFELFLDGRSYGVKPTGAFDAFTRTYTAFQTIQSKRKDKIDAGRDISRALNTYVGFSDTITDGIWTFIRYADNDFDNDIGEVLKAIVFDKKIK